MDKIAVDPQIHFGKPCIVGTRITVQNVLELLNEGLSFSEIIRDYYPELKTEDIRACLQYAIALVMAAFTQNDLYRSHFTTSCKTCINLLLV